jgi:hypothetical protein
VISWVILRLCQTSTFAQDATKSVQHGDVLRLAIPLRIERIFHLRPISLPFAIRENVNVG